MNQDAVNGLISQAISSNNAKFERAIQDQRNMFTSEIERLQKLIYDKGLASNVLEYETQTINSSIACDETLDIIKSLRDFDGTKTSYITKAANDVLTNHGTVLNFEAILARLDFAYADKRPMHIIEQELSVLRQGSISIIEFYNAINCKLTLLTNKTIMTHGSNSPITNELNAMNRRNALRIFITGLNGQLPQILFSLNPPDLPNALAKAQELGRIHNDYRQLPQLFEPMVLGSSVNRPINRDDLNRYKQSHNNHSQNPFRQGNNNNYNNNANTPRWQKPNFNTYNNNTRPVFKRERESAQHSIQQPPVKTERIPVPDTLSDPITLPIFKRARTVNGEIIIKKCYEALIFDTKTRFYVLENLEYAALIGANLLSQVNAKIDFNDNTLKYNNKVERIYFDDKEVINNIQEVKTDQLRVAMMEKIKSIHNDIDLTLPFRTDVMAEIRMANDKPIWSKQLPYPLSANNFVNSEVHKMLEEGIIRPSKSPFNSPVWVVPKKGTNEDGTPKSRLVIDYKKLNESTISDKYPIPDTYVILSNLGKAKYFSTLDLESGFHQIKMKQEDIEKTSFSVNNGKYEYTRLPFGLKNAPSIFQKKKNLLSTKRK
ncbi:uncharacterized protein LOC129944187 [Eupeodes corollae]|uniref:uncharacterized protein LOC129944187 n=1 Tax=Eupeodes corollae TaxID=290404 RepID=UPI002493451E|nr:uncharacterized protein LOC129944187 [Eupeodes corollae]